MLPQLPIRRRRASRVLLLDPLGRVLLLHGRGWWFAVGGGIDEGETPVEAAIREVLEETGLALVPADLGPVILETTSVIPWDDGAPVEQHDEFRIALVAHTTPTTAGFTALELATIDGHRWWSVQELRTTTERIAPADLADLLEARVPRRAQSPEQAVSS